MPVREGDTPLIHAVRRGHVGVVVAMLAEGDYDVNEAMTDGSGITALWMACWTGHVSIVATLLAADADVNKARDIGVTPLYIACEKFHTAIVTVLIAANANVNKARDTGATGSAAHVVLEWGAPWSRDTHKFYPPKVRARVAALMVAGQRLKHADRFLLDVWETYVVPHDIASEMWR